MFVSFVFRLHSLTRHTAEDGVIDGGGMLRSGTSTTRAGAGAKRPVQVSQPQAAKKGSIPKDAAGLFQVPLELARTGLVFGSVSLLSFLIEQGRRVRRRNRRHTRHRRTRWGCHCIRRCAWQTGETLVVVQFAQARFDLRLEVVLHFMEVRQRDVD
jgi:hypothetical protein